MTLDSASYVLCFPHAQGWSHLGRRDRCLRGLLPARAGIVPGRRRGRSGRRAAPRTRGHGPQRCSRSRQLPRCSPHARGWSRLRVIGAQAVDLLTARAGMPRVTCDTECREPLPSYSRLRGFEWYVGVGESAESRASLVRNSQVMQPAPCVRGDGPGSRRSCTSEGCCSLCPRGWSQQRRARAPHRRLLPARAGMVPGLPRDADPAPPAPRTRGDGPGNAVVLTTGSGCSPPARGWSRQRLGEDGGEALLPRTRGDGPVIVQVDSFAASCSPHARGWSRPGSWPGEGVVLLPVPAGMFPRPSGAGSPHPLAPGIRGHGSANVVAGGCVF